jgi:sterol desaturase/sphingolipid hydroxylase (fatty acid hydroxylase superfamily)
LPKFAAPPTEIGAAANPELIARTLTTTRSRAIAGRDARESISMLRMPAFRATEIVGDLPTGRGARDDGRGSVMWIVMAVLAAGYLGLMIVELGRGRARRQRYYSASDVLSNFVNMAGYLFVFGVLYSRVFEPLYLACARFARHELPVTWQTAVLCVIGADFVLYWGHRLAHGPLWPLHHPHHSSEHFNVTTGLRQSWIHTFVVAMYGLPFAFAGVPVTLLLGAVHLIFLYSLFTHTRLFVRLPRWVEFVFVTPSHHRVHHGKNAMYLDRNFGGLLIIWDRMFGTFAPETEAVEFGVAPSAPTTNPIRIQLAPLLMFLRR